MTYIEKIENEIFKLEKEQGWIENRLFAKRAKLQKLLNTDEGNMQINKPEDYLDNIE